MDKKKRRVCLYGGPGIGKSATAAWLFDKMTVSGMNVEHVQEYVKAWAFIGRPPKSFDQVYIFGKQLHREDIILRDTDSKIITDSPVFLSVCYAKLNKFPGWQYLLEIAREFEKRYPSLNIVLDRADCPYKTKGRFQSYKEAKKVDSLIRRYLDSFEIKYHLIKYNDREAVKTLCM